MTRFRVYRFPLSKQWGVVEIHAKKTLQVSMFDTWNEAFQCAYKLAYSVPV